MIEQLVMVKDAERMARYGQRRVAEHFLLLREVKQWIDVIEEVVAGRRPESVTDESRALRGALEDPPNVH